MAGLEMISKTAFALALPLFYLAIGVGIIETLLAWGHHGWCFKGAYLLRCIDVPGGLGIPMGAGYSVNRVESLQYHLPSQREVLFAGWPGLFRSAYLLKGKAVDLGGITRIHVRAPLSTCIGFLAFCALFLGLALSSFLSDGAAAGTVYLLLAIGVFLVIRWRIRQQVAAAPGCLQAILEHVREESEDAEAT